MLLSKLLEGVVPKENIPVPEREISGICSNLDGVVPQCLFVAIKGKRFDPTPYLARAAERGASVILAKDPVCLPDVICLLVDSPRRALALLWENWYKNPSRRLILSGITGTNGKTSTAYLLEHILNAAGNRTGLIGTVETHVGDTTDRACCTTPEPEALSRLFSKMVEYGCSHAVMEVSSQSLDQDRVAALQFQVGIFTNLSVDHLDYHGTMSAYLQAKQKLFEQSRYRVVNADSDYASHFMSFEGAMSYSAAGTADFFADRIRRMEQGIAYRLNYPEGREEVLVPMPGMFGVYNSLAALSGAYCLGLSMPNACASLESFSGVRGRMEYLKTGRPYRVLIDFAHTPDGLKNLLATVRSVTSGRLIVVFGCGGDRDPSKRPLMGQVAADGADIVIVTSDNPRSENPVRIIEEILQGVGRKHCMAIVDRTEAIRYALGIAREGDTVILAGKGHEDYQVLKDKMIHYDEREIVESLLEENSEP